MRPTQTHVRIALVAAALAVVIAAVVIRGTRKRSRPTVIPSVPIVAPLAVAVPPAKAELPPGPPAASYVPPRLRTVITDGVKLVEQHSFDSKECVSDDVIVKRVIRKKGRKTTVRVRVPVIGFKRCLADYILAVTDEHGKVRLARVPERGPSIPSGYRVTVEPGGRRRGVNVPFKVEAPPDRIVVALKTAVLTPGGGAEEGVYVPYSSALDTPELREAGLRYLERIAAGAIADLRINRVRSQFFAGEIVADTVELQHLVTLVLTEQMKSAELFARGTDVERLAMVNRTLTILGANLQDAYTYTRSRVGAAGIAQLMPSTYRRLRAAYPKARLPSSQDARLDHGHAMKAMVLHADAQWYPLATDKHYREWLRVHHDARRLMLAAGYNASAGTVVNAIRACDEVWRQPTCVKLPRETRLYLVKYEAVWSMLYAPRGQTSLAAVP